MVYGTIEMRSFQISTISDPILNASCIAVVVFTPLAPVAITVVILVLTNQYMQIDMMIRCLSQLRTRSGAARFRSFGLNCASSQPKNLRSLSKRLPFAGYALLGVHRYFSKLNGKSNEVIDRSKFTHEVKICMPDLGEGEDVKGERLCRPVHLHPYTHLVPP